MSLHAAHEPDTGTAMPEPLYPAGYRMAAEGLFWADPSDDSKPELRLAGPFQILAETRDGDGTPWGLLLRWSDHDGGVHDWALPRASLAADGIDVRRVLMDGGLALAPSRKARDLLNAFFVQVRTTARAQAVPRVDWHDTAFVLPERVLGGHEAELMVLQTPNALEHAFRVRGSLEDWRANVACYAPGNSRLLLAISAAFATPLLHLVGDESGGLHLRGPSSTGKSTALLAAGSVWGGGGVADYVKSWRATANGLEGVALAHCDCLLCLDEIGQLAPREVGEVAHMLANGTGKSRAKRDGAARQPAQWRTLFLSSGEIGLADKAAEDGVKRRFAAGQEVRVIDLPADAGRGLGLFENLHDFASADALARHLREVSGRNYGSAAMAFLSAVADDMSDIAEAVAGHCRDFVSDVLPAQADGQVSRVARRFALISAAGELATRLGILPWRSGEVDEAAKRCFAEWLQARGGVEPGEIRHGIAQVRQFVELHGQSRFAAWDNPDNTLVRDRVGFRHSSQEGGIEYYVMPEAWRNEVCRGLDAAAVARALAERGMLRLGSDGRPQTPTRLPGHGRTVRCYVLTEALLGEAVNAD